MRLQGPKQPSHDEVLNATCVSAAMVHLNENKDPIRGGASVLVPACFFADEHAQAAHDQKRHGAGRVQRHLRDGRVFVFFSFFFFLCYSMLL